MKTDIAPLMEILDEKHVLVDYSKSFSIPKFEKIKSATVRVDSTDVAVATRDNITDLSGKSQQKLVEGEKIKVKLSPCQVHSFSVRLSFQDNNSTHQCDSFVNTYHPVDMWQVRIYTRYKSVTRFV